VSCWYLAFSNATYVCLDLCGLRPGSIQTSYNLYELLTYWQMCFQNSGAVSVAFLTDQCEPIYVESAGPRAWGPGPLRELGRLGRALGLLYLSRSSRFLQLGQTTRNIAHE
jgi:hypothetical protein